MSNINLNASGDNSKIKTSDIITDDGQKKTKVSIKVVLKYFISGFISGIITSLIANWIFDFCKF